MPTDTRDVVVFLGPTLPRAEATAILDATYRPPVQQGDVAALVPQQPAAILIVDGFFSWVPSVWHKEILWALEQGVAVLGASSMGALRAAELHDFGMVGVGRVYDDFAAGRLHDDDEVAVLHADEEHAYRPLSDALVNIRATLGAAVDAGVVDGTTAADLVLRAKATFFPDRRLASLVDDARRDGAHDAAAPADLARWCRSNACDVKASDARELLARVAAGWHGERAGAFVLQPTLNWLQLQRSACGAATSVGSGAAVGSVTRSAKGSTVDDVLVECRVAGTWPVFEAQALARLAVTRPSVAAGRVTDDEYLTELARFCAAQGLDSLDDVSGWLVRVGWDSEHLAELLAREALFARARQSGGEDLHVAIHEMLVLTGVEPTLARRAEEKRSWIATRDRSRLLAADPERATEWFRSLVRADRASDHALALDHGWPSTVDMHEDLLVEHAFRADEAERQTTLHR